MVAMSQFHMLLEKVLRCLKVRQKQECEDPGVFLVTVASCPLDYVAWLLSSQQTKTCPAFKGQLMPQAPL